MSEQQKTLAILDDHPIAIEGIKSFLKENLSYDRVLGFSLGQALTDFLKQDQVDLLLLDIALPDANGIDLCGELKKNHPELIIVGFSNHMARNSILQMLANGAAGYILKSADAEEIITCIRKVSQGSMALCGATQRIIAASPTRQLPSLTMREKQVLQLLAEGKTSAQIAEKLFLSPLTVDTYRKNLIQKFAVKNTAELLTILFKENLL